MSNLVYFVRMQVYIKNKVLAVGLLGKRVNAFVILIDITKLSSNGVVPICTPASNVREACFPIAQHIKDVRFFYFSQSNR